MKKNTINRSFPTNRNFCSQKWFYNATRCAEMSRDCRARIGAFELCCCSRLLNNDGCVANSRRTEKIKHRILIIRNWIAGGAVTSIPLYIVHTRIQSGSSRSAYVSQTLRRDIATEARHSSCGKERRAIQRSNSAENGLSGGRELIRAGTIYSAH